jgi:hypothetical protein
MVNREYSPGGQGQSFRLFKFTIPIVAIRCFNPEHAFDCFCRPVSILIESRIATAFSTTTIEQPSTLSITPARPSVYSRGEGGAVGLGGPLWSPVGWGRSPSIGEPTFSGDPQRATIKVHRPSSQPPSPLRNPCIESTLMPIGRLSRLPCCGIELSLSTISPVKLTK